MKEVKKLYLNGNTYIVALGAIIGIPVTKLAADTLYPAFIANTAMGMDLTFSWYLYVGIFAGIMLIYFIINGFLAANLKKIQPAEVLKNRE
jgi:putative ABC transport system permease protein